MADELMRRGIVATISPRHAQRLLQKGDLQPHRIRYWLTPADDPGFDVKVANVCEVYRLALNTKSKESAP